MAAVLTRYDTSSYVVREEIPVALKLLVGPQFSSYGAIVSRILFNPPVCKSSRARVGPRSVPGLPRFSNGIRHYTVDHDRCRFIFRETKVPGPK